MESQEEKWIDEIEALVKEISKIQFKSEADLANVVFVAMKFMSAYKNLHGLSKRAIVIEALKKTVELQKNLSPALKNGLIIFIDNAAASIIDTFYEISISKINFNASGGCTCFPRERK